MHSRLLELEVLARDTSATGDPFLDGLYALDATAAYYRLLYRLVRAISPELVVELGVFTARGTAHIAAACRETKVIGVDPFPKDISEILDRYPNIQFLKDKSYSKSVLDLVADGSVDICFFDTLHEYQVVLVETQLWFPKMKRGGIMLFDDISLNDGMKKFWSELNLPKLSLPWLHHSGFGAAVAELNG